MDEHIIASNTTLASELISELKATSKRWFIAFCVMVGLEIATIAGFIWYISLPVEETTSTQEVDQDTNGGGNNTFVGGDSNGKTED